MSGRVGYLFIEGILNNTFFSFQTKNNLSDALHQYEIIKQKIFIAKKLELHQRSQVVGGSLIENQSINSGIYSCVWTKYHRVLDVPKNVIDSTKYWVMEFQERVWKMMIFQSFEYDWIVNCKGMKLMRNILHRIAKYFSSPGRHMKF